jgi:RHS repeat-associated protein
VPASGVFRLSFKPGDSNSGNLDGIVSDGLEYRRYQTGATATWVPIRLPGQYLDPETDLFQNWNRFYDPSIGRYLEPDPAWSSPAGLLSTFRLLGRSAPVYAYVSNNPVINTDPKGLLWQTDGDPRSEAALFSYAYHDRENFQRMREAPTLFYVRADNYVTPRYFFNLGALTQSANLGLTTPLKNGVITITLFFNEIARTSEHTPAYVMAHETSHARENAGMESRCIPPFCEKKADSYANSVTKEGVKKEELDRWKDELKEWRKANPEIEDQIKILLWYEGRPPGKDLDVEKILLDPYGLLPGQNPNGR